GGRRWPARGPSTGNICGITCKREVVLAVRPLLLPADPKAGYLAHQAEINAAVQRVLHSGWYILGPEVTQFEQEFARYVGVGHAVGVGRGTAAPPPRLRGGG